MLFESCYQSEVSVFAACRHIRKLVLTCANEFLREEKTCIVQGALKTSVGTKATSVGVPTPSGVNEAWVLLVIVLNGEALGPSLLGQPQWP